MEIFLCDFFIEQSPRKPDLHFLMDVSFTVRLMLCIFFSCNCIDQENKSGPTVAGFVLPYHNGSL